MAASRLLCAAALCKICSTSIGKCFKICLFVALAPRSGSGAVEVWNVKKRFAWSCIALGSHAAHVLGLQHRNSFAQSTHAWGWRTAHASSIDEKGLIVQPKSNFRPDSCGYYWYMVSCAKSSLGWLPRGKHGQTHSLKNHNRRPHIADGHIRFILLFPFEIRKNVEARDHGTMPEAPCSEGEALNFCWWWLWCLGTNLKPENTGRTP